MFTRGMYTQFNFALYGTQTQLYLLEVVTFSVAYERSACSSIQLLKSLCDKLQYRKLAHLKLIFLRSRLDKSTDSKLIP
jgi:hypothetical protein